MKNLSAVARATFGRRERPTRRPGAERAGAVIAVWAALAVVLVAPAPAYAAAPTRNDSKNEAVVFVHGLNRSQNSDCTGEWAAAGSVLRNQGFTGSFVTFGYYGGNTRCTKKFNGTTDTSLDTVAKELAKYIYNEFSRHDKPVDIVAHSMGGLIARRAISGTELKEAGFPAFLYVEDVVTIATPHQGTNIARLCAAEDRDDRQCRQMVPGNTWLRNLASKAHNPQSRFGTDWSTIGSNTDQLVRADSARGMNAGHKYTYSNAPNADHTGLRVHNSTARTFDVAWQHVGRDPGVDTNAAAALYITANALYYWRTW